MKLKPPGTAASLLLLTGLTLACLLPFIDKAFHIDDPLFVWCARHLQSDPFNFYNFTVNWEGRPKGMAFVTENPPLASYYMEPIGALFGWNEVALHAWFLLPALALGAGTFILARRFCAHPLAAALLTVTAPVFILSSTSVMCDILMTALWVWAAVFWTAGLPTGKPAQLLVAAILISACELTKYFGMSLIALLLVYSLVEKRRIGPWLGWLLIPVLVLGFYQWFTSRLYGRGLLFNAAAYALHWRVGGDILQRMVTGLAFSGGCIIVLLPLAPCLWNRKWLAAGLVVLVALALSNPFSILGDGHMKGLYAVQFAGAVLAGGSLLWLAAADWFKRRTALAMLLFLWVGGTFLFAAVVNWTVSGRNILPLLPAAAILMVRRLELRNGIEWRKLAVQLCLPLGFTVVVALLAAWADYRLAASARDAATVIMQKTAPSLPWFEGHWGFQYYMEQLGARAIDMKHPQLSSGDLVVIPLGNSFAELPAKDHFDLWSKYEGDKLPRLSTMSGQTGAGFYSASFGRLPYVFGEAPRDEYLVFQFR